MDDYTIFPLEEYEARLQNVRRSMEKNDLDACLVSVPENIYYLIGLTYQGYFVPHILIVPQEGEMHLVLRAMESKTFEVQIKNARVAGYTDNEDPAKVTSETLTQMGFGSGKLGIEKNSMFLPPILAEKILGNLPNAHWSDSSGLVDKHRIIKSPREIEYTRQAARVTEAMMQAAIDAAAEGVSEEEVTCESYRAMISAGGENPGFTPLVRSTPTLEQEHTSWGHYKLTKGDPLFLEMSGCVRRYHAPMGRFLFIGEAPQGTEYVEKVCIEAFGDVVKAIRPGIKAADVYEVWQSRVDSADLSHYQRHHCGYVTGIGFPPSWVGGSMVVGLRQNNEFTLQSGMVFHLMSWLIGTVKGDYFVSDTGLVTENGCEVLTKIPRQIHIA